MQRGAGFGVPGHCGFGKCSPQQIDSRPGACTHANSRNSTIFVALSRRRHACEIDDPRISALDLQYHDLRPGKSLFARLGTERLIDEADVFSAVTTPPQTTRAYFRGECLRRY